MNEPILIELDGRTYIRWNAGVYTCDGSDHPYGLRQRVTDVKTVDKLNAKYGDLQRQHTPKGPRPPVGVPHVVSPPAVRSKGQHKTNRESRSGRQE